MRTKILICAAVLMLAACNQQSSEPKVMARYVPERCDDFILENNLVCGRFYGEALEGNPTSPGFDIWVKLPGELVANQRYVDELENGLSYHIDRGNGKDCYKVAVSLGAGASSPLVDGKLVFPATNYRSWEIISSNDNEIVFVLHYPAWEVNGSMVALDKKITVTADSYFFKAEDRYTGDFESITVAAGFWNHNPGISQAMVAEDRFAIWETASDQSVEPEDGMIGVGVIVDRADSIVALPGEREHLVAIKTLKSGEIISYRFGSCWSKGDIQSAEAWFERVKTE